MPALAVLLAGCYSRSDMEAEQGAGKTTPAATEQPEPTAAATKPKGNTAPGPAKTAASATSFPQVNVFLEVSGSMQGFMPAAGANAQTTQFQQQVSEWLSGLERDGRVQQRRYFRIADRPIADTYRALSETVRRGIRQPATSTSIPAILDTVANRYLADEAISVIISDFIYSPQNPGDVPYINTDIADALAHSRRDLAVSVYAFKSDFKGTYYPAMKGKVAGCCPQPIPYYMWVLGPAELVGQFDATLMKDQRGEQAHFGLAAAEVPSSVLSRFHRKGTWFVADAGKQAGAGGHAVAVEEATAEEPAEFVVGLDLAQLPELFQKPEYLQKNLALRGNTTTAKVAKVEAATEATRRSGGPEAAYTHFATIRVTAKPRSKQDLTLALPAARPTWVQQWSTANDSKPGPYTFALNRQLDGLQRLLASRNTGTNAADVLRVSLSIQPD
ncbi:hypothetical protein F0P96_14425 [Hymenobacter busanensis]|uniref:Uncharacterized protein n=1 Tax=Hymenobacter busanensis TaxID=2607656 RepID=A0A7L5A3S3_9BACT|nr:hypothetical protein [Hymenobacter busanensis]KAA9331436.1 hypothetical protein F0P96_14425 [Hymenobacter busanensis]QHJ08590.1 hypothetical protein GUY19_15355 [Hymenobacter busanensis]